MSDTSVVVPPVPVVISVHPVVTNLPRRVHDPSTSCSFLEASTLSSIDSVIECGLHVSSSEVIGHPEHLMEFYSKTRTLNPPFYTVPLYACFYLHLTSVAESPERSGGRRPICGPERSGGHANKSQRDVNVPAQRKGGVAGARPRSCLYQK